MKTIIFLLLSVFAVNSDAGECFTACESWDTFCKSPLQIVATKCRLGVPVNDEQCMALGVDTRFSIAGQVEGLPCSADKAGTSTLAIIQTLLAEASASK